MVAADGKQIKVKRRSRSQESKPRTTETGSKPIESRPEIKRSQPVKLSKEEMDAKLREMTKNAEWRDKERSEKVRSYREKERREEEESKKEFDEDFRQRQMKQTSRSLQSVESRIKSNLGSIQRSSRAMDANFARR